MAVILKKRLGFIAHDGAIRKIRYDQNRLNNDRDAREASPSGIVIGIRKRHRFTDRHLNDAVFSSAHSIVVGGDKGHLSQVGANPWRIQGSHNLAVFGVALDPTRKQLLSVGTTNALNIWDVETGENTGSIALDLTWGHTINVIEDEAWVGDEQGRIHIIQLSNDAPAIALKVCNSRIISSATTDGIIAVGCENGQMGILDTKQRRLIIAQTLLQTLTLALISSTMVSVGSTGPTMRFMEEYDKAASKEINWRDDHGTTRYRTEAWCRWGDDYRQACGLSNTKRVQRFLASIRSSGTLWRLCESKRR